MSRFDTRMQKVVSPGILHPPNPQSFTFTDSTNQTVLPFFFKGGISVSTFSKSVPACSPSLGLLQAFLYLHLLSRTQSTHLTCPVKVWPVPWPTQNLCMSLKATPHWWGNFWGSQASLWIWDHLIRSPLPPSPQTYCINQEVGKGLVWKDGDWDCRAQRGFQGHLISVSWIFAPGFPRAQR